MDVWEELRREPPASVIIDGVTVRRGSRVQINPRARGDIFDSMLAGKFAVVEGLEENMDGEIQVAVTLEDDPGRDMGEGRYPGHRFFFSTGEVLPVANGDAVVAGDRVPHILIAGVGNIFLGDDAFGVAVAQQLVTRTLPDGVHARDFGIRGMDLAYALQNNYDAVIFVDASPRGEAPGTLYVIDAQVDADGPVAVDTHGMNPERVLALARALGRVPSRVIVLGCEPQNIQPIESWSEMQMTLSAPVLAAVPEAITQIETIVNDLITDMKLSVTPGAVSVPSHPAAQSSD